MEIAAYAPNEGNGKANDVLHEECSNPASGLSRCAGNLDGCGWTLLVSLVDAGANIRNRRRHDGDKRVYRILPILLDCEPDERTQVSRFAAEE